jgi:hypothetical protein
MADNHHTIIPAQPGWFLVLFMPGEGTDDPDSVRLDPIIAWDIPPDRGKKDRCMPLSVSGNPDYYWCAYPWAIKRPDGSFETEFGDDLKTEQDLMVHLRDQFERDEKIGQYAKHASVA